MTVSKAFRAFIDSRPAVKSSLKVAAWIPVAIFYTQHIASVLAIEGRSMQPTFNPDDNMMHEDVVLLNRWAKVTNNFRVGDVVTFWYASAICQLVSRKSGQSDNANDIGHPD